MRANSSLLHWRMPAASVLCILLAAGCGKDTPKSAFPETVKKYAQVATLEGMVSDNAGPIKLGTVKAYDEKENVIAETALQGSDHYKIEIPAGTALPIVLTFSRPQGVEKMIAAVVHPNVTKYDITPLSTAIAKKAKALGGYTHGNLLVAAESMGTVPDDNKMTAGFRGDPTKQYGGWH